MSNDSTSASTMIANVVIESTGLGGIPPSRIPGVVATRHAADRQRRAAQRHCADVEHLGLVALVRPRHQRGRNGQHHDGQRPGHQAAGDDPVLHHHGADDVVLSEPELCDHEEAQDEAEELPRVLEEQVTYRQLGHVPGDLDEWQDEEGDRDRDDCVDEREETIEVTVTLDRTLASAITPGPSRRPG